MCMADTKLNADSGNDKYTYWLSHTPFIQLMYYLFC